MIKCVKKYSGYFLRYILVFIVLFSSMIVVPIEAKAASATTLAELRQELKNLQAKKANYANQKAMSEAEKNKKNQEIMAAQQGIQDAEADIAAAKQDIIKTNEKIDELKGQTEQVLKYYQMMSGENAYLEFVSESSTMTELIMRIDAVARVIDYNKEKLGEMEDLISKNEQKQVDLKNKEDDLNAQIVANEKRINALDSSILALADLSIDINEEIKIVESNIKMYENMGCGENQKFTECASYSYNDTWLKPINKGMVTSLFGWRTLNGKSNFHSGVDIGTPENTPVYSSTSGKVVYIIRRSSCGGNQVYIESEVKGVRYTMLYAHLLSINVSVGDKVHTNTIIGYSGGKSTQSYDSCTFGAHLHFSVSKSNWTTWSHFYNNLINPPGFPSKGSWFYSRTQYFS